MKMYFLLTIIPTLMIPIYSIKSKEEWCFYIISEKWLNKKCLIKQDNQQNYAVDLIYIKL